MKRTSEMTKMSFPFERVALDRMDTLLTLGDAVNEVAINFGLGFNLKGLTVVSEHDVFTAECFEFLFLFDIFQVERLLLLDHVVSQDVFRELWNTKRVKAPINRVPSLESVVTWDENDVGVSCVCEKIL